MKTVTHFFYLDHETTDEEISNAFTQQFMHVHLGDETILIRKMKYSGTRIEPKSDLMENVLDEIEAQPELKSAIEKFLNE